MKKLLFILLLAFAFNAQAQTTYTFTGAAGNADWFNAGNWDANGIPTLMSSSTDVIIINAYAEYIRTIPNGIDLFLRENTHFILNADFFIVIQGSNSAVKFQCALMTLNTTNFSVLGNPTFEAYIFENTLVEGNGSIFAANPDGLLESNINNITISPGTVSTKGTITVRALQIINSTFIIDLFDVPSTGNYDTINFSDASLIHPATLNVNRNGYSPVLNDVFTPFTKQNGIFFPVENFSIGQNVTTDMQTFGYTVTPNLNTGNSTGTITITDIQGPSITNCPGNLTVDADCGTYYGVPDYTVGLTATDNDTASSITYSQTPLPGTGALDGTVITLTATDASGNSSDCTFTLNVTQQTLTIPEVEGVVGRNITVYPNPSKGIFTLKNTSGLLLETGQVINANGALVKTVDLSSYNPNKTINLADLSAGIYMFKILTVDGSVTKKISIE